MTTYLLSTVWPAPLGFSYRTEIKRKDLLGGIFAIYTHTPDTLITLEYLLRLKHSYNTWYSHY